VCSDPISATVELSDFSVCTEKLKFFFGRAARVPIPPQKGGDVAAHVG
jgi:hypothetical protein